MLYLIKLMPLFEDDFFRFHNMNMLTCPHLKFLRYPFEIVPHFDEEILDSSIETPQAHFDINPVKSQHLKLYYL